MTMRIEGNPAPLFEALAKARAEFRPIRKTREVKVQSDRGSYTFSYAELDELIDATVPALAANGLAVFHSRHTSVEGEAVVHFLTHSSGAYLMAQQVIPMTKVAWDNQSKERVERRLTEQEFGSAFTYARRYAYQALLNLAAEDDDDANRADGNQAESRDRRQAPSPRPEPKAAPAVSQRPASAPPPPRQEWDVAKGEPKAEQHSQHGVGLPPVELVEDTRPAQSDSELDRRLSAAFGELRKSCATPVVNTWARKITGKPASGWTVSDGKRFLEHFDAGERP